MITLRPSRDRGHADHGWLSTYHTFSFADYYDPAWVGYGLLRVINDDRVAPGQGFGKHGRRDTQIVTCILAGRLEHQDGHRAARGRKSTVRSGCVGFRRRGTPAGSDR